MTEERETHLRARLTSAGVKAIGPSGLRCADLLSRWLGGLHHWPNAKPISATRWDDFFVRLVFFGHLATFDFANLTSLVFLAHDLGIRVEINACNMQRVEIMLHPRHRDPGSVMCGHPTLEEAVTRWRDGNPLPGDTAGEGGE